MANTKSLTKEEKAYLDKQIQEMLQDNIEKLMGTKPASENSTPTETSIETGIGKAYDAESDTYWFTNFTNKDFKSMWNKVEYTFKARTKSPLIIRDANSEEKKQVLRIFAYKLVKQYVENDSPESKDISKLNDPKATFGGWEASGEAYAPAVINKYANKCFEDLEVSKAETKKLEDPSLILSTGVAFKTGEEIQEMVK